MHTTNNKGVSEEEVEDAKENGHEEENKESDGQHCTVSNEGVNEVKQELIHICNHIQSTLNKVGKWLYMKLL